MGALHLLVCAVLGISIDGACVVKLMRSRVRDLAHLDSRPHMMLASASAQIVEVYDELKKKKTQRSCPMNVGKGTDEPFRPPFRSTSPPFGLHPRESRLPAQNSGI